MYSHYFYSVINVHIILMFVIKEHIVAQLSDIFNFYYNSSIFTFSRDLKNSGITNK